MAVAEPRVGLHLRENAENKVEQQVYGAASLDADRNWRACSLYQYIFSGGLARKYEQIIDKTMNPAIFPLRFFMFAGPADVQVLWRVFLACGLDFESSEMDKEVCLFRCFDV